MQPGWNNKIAIYTFVEISNQADDCIRVRTYKGNTPKIVCSVQVAVVSVKMLELGTRLKKVKPLCLICKNTLISCTCLYLSRCEVTWVEVGRNTDPCPLD